MPSPEGHEKKNINDKWYFMQACVKEICLLRLGAVSR